MEDKEILAAFVGEREELCTLRDQLSAQISTLYKDKDAAVKRIQGLNQVIDGLRSLMGTGSITRGYTTREVDI